MNTNNEIRSNQDVFTALIEEVAFSFINPETSVKFFTNTAQDDFDLAFTEKLVRSVMEFTSTNGLTCSEFLSDIDPVIELDYGLIKPTITIEDLLAIVNHPGIKIDTDNAQHVNGNMENAVEVMTVIENEVNSDAANNTPEFQLLKYRKRAFSNPALEAKRELMLLKLKKHYIAVKRKEGSAFHINEEDEMIDAKELNDDADNSPKNTANNKTSDGFIKPLGLTAAVAIGAFLLYGYIKNK